MIIGWIITLGILNAVFIVFKTFIRHIKEADDNSKNKDIDVFDYSHQYRYQVGSIIDYLDGISILYFIYCIALAIQKQK